MGRRSPISEIPHETHANLQVPAQVCDFKGGAVCSKNSTLAISMKPRGPCRLLSPTPIMTPDNALFVSHSALGNLPLTSLPVLYPQCLGGVSLA